MSNQDASQVAAEFLEKRGRVQFFEDYDHKEMRGSRFGEGIPKTDISQPPLTKTNYVLIDQENVHVTSVARLKSEQFRVLLFISPHHKSLPADLVLSMQDLGERAKFVKIENTGPNSLDFHIAYYLGILSEREPHAFFHVISKDTGFDPVLKHMKSRKIFSTRSPAIEEMPCFKPHSKPASTPVGAHEPNSSSFDQRLRLAIGDLRSRKTGKPGSLKTLLSTIHAKCGKQLPLADIQAVVDELVKRKYVTVDGSKVSYALPPSD